MFSLKRYSQNIWKPFGICFCLLILCYLMLGLFAWMIPDAPVRNHVRRTLDRGDLCDQHVSAIILRGRCQLDNYTDALIVNQALMLRTEGIKSVLLIPRRYDDTVQTTNLALAAHEAPNPVITYYARYWCGTTFITRLLLSVTDYIGIRYFLYIVTSLLLLWLCVSLWNRGWKSAMWAVAYSLLLVNVFVMQFSMQFSPSLIIAVGAMLWLCYHSKADRRGLAILFFTIGSITAYLDMITVPTITLGLPLALYVWIKAEKNIWYGLRSVATIMVIWTIGYTFTWVAKWMLASIFTDFNVFANAYEQSKYWSNGGVSWIAKALVSNLAHLRVWYIIVPFVLLAYIMVICHQRQGRSVATQLLVVALIPFIYYILMPRPAMVHNW